MDADGRRAVVTREQRVWVLRRGCRGDEADPKVTERKKRE